MTVQLSVPTVQRQHPVFAGLLTVGLRASIGAVGVNVAVFATARGFGIEFVSAESSRSAGEVTFGAVLAATLLAMAVGWSLAAWALRRQRPRLRTVAIVGAGFAAVSTLLPATFNGPVSARLVLAGLHLIAGGFFVLGITRVSNPDGKAAA